MNACAACAICGAPCASGRQGFVFSQASWADTLRITHLDEKRNLQRGSRAVCSSEHAEKLVAQWIVTGSLNFPFARAVLGVANDELSWAEESFDDDALVCELAVHRDSIERLLQENPQFLETMVQALGEALGGNGNDEAQTTKRPSEPAQVASASVFAD